MKDYKVIQKINNLLKSEKKSSVEIITDHREDAIIAYCIQYFSEECGTLSYPAKSYCVAIIYSHLLSFYFQENFYEVLNDPELLCLNDDYFKTYSESKSLYDLILNEIGYSKNFVIDLNLSQLRSTFEYFGEEFSVELDSYLSHSRC